MYNKVLFTILISLLYFQSFGQSKELTLNDGSTTTLHEAITQLNESGTINLTGEVIIDVNITVPAGIILKISSKGSFNIQKGNTLKIIGALEADLHQIFNDKVEFSDTSVSEIKAEWFGSGDTAVNHALSSAAKIPVRITNDIVVTNTIIIASHQTLTINEGTKLRVTNEMRGAAVITNKTENDMKITIHGGIIDGTGADSVAYDGVLFNKVRNSSITNLSCLNVHTTASRDTGNIRLNDCSYVLLKNCSVTGTWKMGIFVLNGSCNSIIGGKFYGTHDSAIGVVNSYGATIDGLYVDNCGTSDGSNMSLNSERMLVINNTSINASGTRNGNGITLGHDGGPASYSVCSNNFISNNKAKGIFIQGKNTKNVLVLENTIIGNGNDSDGTNSGGIAVYSNTRGHLISDNKIKNNRLGISLHKTSQHVSIINNKITSSALFVIRNDGENTTIQANYFYNVTNIQNGRNYKNLMLKNNVFKSE